MFQHEYGHGAGAPGFLLIGGVWFLLILAAALLVMWLFNRTGIRRTPVMGEHEPISSVTPSSGPSPAEVLDLRLARGEVDLDTYRALRAELTGGGADPRPVP